LTLYSTRFGSSIEPKEYELVVVYWQSDRQQVSDGNTTTTEQVAANQTVERHSITLNKHYDKANVSLRSHYDQSVEVSMWLVDPETDEPVDGATRRVVFEPTAGSEWLRHEEVWSGDRWRTLGTEWVERLTVENAEVLADER